MNKLQAAVCATFEALEQNEQMDLLQKEGVYIGKLKSGSGTVLLYQYQTVYVEVVYSVHRTHITSVHCFTDTAVIDRYLGSSDFDAQLP